MQSSAKPVFTGEKGYEIYVRDAHENAEIVWNSVIEAGEEFGLMVIAPAHHRRIAAGILSWGQDLDLETSPFQVNLSYQVPTKIKKLITSVNKSSNDNVQ